MTKITPCLWFDGAALEAAEFYVGVFRTGGKPAGLGRIAHYGPGTPFPEDSVMTVEFGLADQGLLALNGGSEFRFTPALSLAVACADQAEIDFFWDRLGEGGAHNQCGWLTDRYGLSWQVIPEALPDLVNPADRARNARVMQALMGMTKLDLAALQAA